MKRRVGVTGYFTCACCGQKFWQARKETTFVWCHTATGMPVEKGTAGAVLRPLGLCCKDEVLAALSTDPAELDQFMGADGLDAMS